LDITLWTRKHEYIKHKMYTKTLVTCCCFYNSQPSTFLSQLMSNHPGRSIPSGRKGRWARGTHFIKAYVWALHSLYKGDSNIITLFEEDWKCDVQTSHYPTKKIFVIWSKPYISDQKEFYYWYTCGRISSAELKR